jgi:membrane-associated phospholipid phosphatase
VFQTEISLFLQSFANDVLTFMFKLFSDLGLSSTITPMVIVITVGIHFRIGLMLMHTVFWSGVGTMIFKEVFALPRPANVDAAVQLLGKDAPNPTPFKSMGAEGFFDSLPQQVVDWLRSHRIDSFGLPSGHTGVAVGFWGALYIYFKQTWIRIGAVVFMIAVPLSRMYLGRHFLADILAGAIWAFAVLNLFYWCVYRNDMLRVYLLEKVLHLRLQLKTFLTAAYFLAVPFVLLLVPIDSWNLKNEITMPATLLGMNLAFLLLWKRGLPRESGTVRQRVLRTILGLFFFFLVGFLLKGAAGLLFAAEPVAARFVRLTLTFCLSLWGGVELTVKLKLFERERVTV